MSLTIVILYMLILFCPEKIFMTYAFLTIREEGADGEVLSPTCDLTCG